MRYAVFLPVFLVGLLLASLASLPSAAGRHVRSKYWQASQDEYAAGFERLQLIPPTQPQQILTSLSGTAHAVTVTWITWAETNSSVVQWGADGQLDSSDSGSAFRFVDPNPSHGLRVVHTAHMRELKPGSEVQYRVGDEASGAWSDQLSFSVPTEGEEVLRLIVYGDMGLVNARSVQHLIHEVQNGTADAVLHDGDYAYNLDSKNGSVGDVFLNNLMPISTRVPYLGVLGNHEQAFNFSHFTNKFTAYNDLGQASGSNTNWWFSWEYVSGGAKVHFAALNTEMYFHAEYAAQREAQYRWLDADLRAARASADWLIVYGHRPMYCSNLDTLTDCTSDAKLLRDGYDGQWGVEDLIAQHNVDIYFGAHEHDYERIFPVYRGAYEQQLNHSHSNPRFPIHIVSGSAGCSEGLEWFDDVLIPPWSVVRSVSYGYGHLLVHNDTHAYWDQLLDEGEGGRDWLWIERNHTRKGQPAMTIQPVQPWLSEQ